MSHIFSLQGKSLIKNNELAKYLEKVRLVMLTAFNLNKMYDPCFSNKWSIILNFCR